MYISSQVEDLHKKYTDHKKLMYSSNVVLFPEGILSGSRVHELIFFRIPTDGSHYRWLEAHRINVDGKLQFSPTGRFINYKIFSALLLDF